MPKTLKELRDALNALNDDELDTNIIVLDDNEGEHLTTEVTIKGLEEDTPEYDEGTKYLHLDYLY